MPFDDLWAMLIVAFHLQPSEANALELSEVWLLVAKAHEGKKKPSMTRDEFKKMRKALNQ